MKLIIPSMLLAASFLLLSTRVVAGAAVGLLAKKNTVNKPSIDGHIRATDDGDNVHHDYWLRHRNIQQQQQQQQQQQHDDVDQKQQTCSYLEAYNTSYSNNEIDDSSLPIPPFPGGIMFEISSKAEDPIEILTLEINVRRTITSTATTSHNNHNDNNNDSDENDDLWMEVYSIKGQYELFIGDESAWTLHARTIAIPAAPESSSIIIPRHDFIPILMESFERRSFYVRIMNNTNASSSLYNIDFNVHALSKTGENFQENNDLIFYTGIGLQDNFTTTNGNAATGAAVVFPQFAGVVHYYKKQSHAATKCQTTTTTTTTTMVNFQFLTKLSLTSALLTRVNDIINMALDTEILTLPMFMKYKTEFGLQRDDIISTISTTTTIPFMGNCPLSWERCVNSAISTTVALKHLNTLSSSDILQLMYQFSPIHEILQQALVHGLDLENADDAATVGVAQQDQIISIGLNTTFVDFIITIHGVPQQQQNGNGQAQTMNALQQVFFEDTMLKFLQTYLLAKKQTTTNHVEVYSVHVTRQQQQQQDEEEATASSSTKTNNNSHAGSTTTIQLHGTILGAQNAYSYIENFANEIELTLLQQNVDNGLNLLDIIHTSILRPYYGDATDDDILYNYFINVTNITVESIVPGNNNPSSFLDDDNTESNVTEETKQQDTNRTVLLIIAMIAGGIVGLFGLVTAIYYIYKYCMAKAVYAKELEAYRLEMKLERRRRRRGEMVVVVSSTVQTESESSASHSSDDKVNKQQQQQLQLQQQHSSTTVMESKRSNTSTNTTTATKKKKKQKKRSAPHNSSTTCAAHQQSIILPDDIESGAAGQSSQGGKNEK